MTGPEHYREAENLLALARDRADRGVPVAASDLIAAAQVHATLALVAATVVSPSRSAQGEWGHS